MTMINRLNEIYFDCLDARRVISRGIIFLLFLVILSPNNALAIDDEFVEYCLSSVFEDKYKNAGCWSCDIIKILIRSMLDLTDVLFKEVRELSILILQLGGAIWLAIYLMKSLSALTAQDPAKVIDGALMFMFKWAIVYTVIFAGMDVIMQYIVNPLLSIGFDVGMEIAGAAGISVF